MAEHGFPPAAHTQRTPYLQRGSPKAVGPVGIHACLQQPPHLFVVPAGGGAAQAVAVAPGGPLHLPPADLSRTAAAGFPSPLAATSPVAATQLVTVTELLLSRGQRPPPPPPGPPVPSPLRALLQRSGAALSAVSPPRLPAAEGYARTRPGRGAPAGRPRTAAAWPPSTAPRRAARSHPRLKHGWFSRGFSPTGESGGGGGLAPPTSPHIGAGCEGRGAGRRPTGKQLPRQLPRAGQVGRRHDEGTTDLNFPEQRGTLCVSDGSSFCLRKGSCFARAHPSGGSGADPSVLCLPRAGRPDEEGSRARNRSATKLMAAHRISGSLQPGPARAFRE